MYIVWEEWGNRIRLSMLSIILAPQFIFPYWFCVIRLHRQRQLSVSFHRQGTSRWELSWSASGKFSSDFSNIRWRVDSRTLPLINPGNLKTCRQQSARVFNCRRMADGSYRSEKAGSSCGDSGIKWAIWYTIRLFRPIIFFCFLFCLTAH